MRLLANTDSLASFQQDTQAHLTRLRETGQPELLTVPGESELVIQDARAYQAMVDHLDELEALVAIREGIATALAGQGKPFNEFFDELEAEMGTR